MIFATSNSFFSIASSLCWRWEQYDNQTERVMVKLSVEELLGGSSDF